MMFLFILHVLEQRCDRDASSDEYGSNSRWQFSAAMRMMVHTISSGLLSNEDHKHKLIIYVY